MKSDEELVKNSEAQQIYDEIFLRLEKESSYAEIGYWLNETGVPTGPYARNEKWDGRMVSTTVHNPILKGDRFRNKRTS